MSKSHPYLTQLQTYQSMVAKEPKLYDHAELQLAQTIAEIAQEEFNKLLLREVAGDIKFLKELFVGDVAEVLSFHSTPEYLQDSFQLKIRVSALIPALEKLGFIERIL